MGHQSSASFLKILSRSFQLTSWTICTRVWGNRQGRVWRWIQLAPTNPLTDCLRQILQTVCRIAWFRLQICATCLHRCLKDVKFRSSLTAMLARCQEFSKTIGGASDETPLEAASRADDPPTLVPLGVPESSRRWLRLPQLPFAKTPLPTSSKPSLAHNRSSSAVTQLVCSCHYYRACVPN